jgi:hypothetical protein
LHLRHLFLKGIDAMTTTQAKRAVARVIKLSGFVATLTARRADWLSDDARPIVFVRQPVPPVVEAAVRLALPKVRVVFAHAEPARAA